MLQSRESKRKFTLSVSMCKTHFDCNIFDGIRKRLKSQCLVLSVSVVSKCLLQVSKMLKRLAL